MQHQPAQGQQQQSKSCAGSHISQGETQECNHNQWGCGPAGHKEGILHAVQCLLWLRSTLMPVIGHAAGLELQLQATSPVWYGMDTRAERPRCRRHPHHKARQRADSPHTHAHRARLHPHKQPVPAVAWGGTAMKRAAVRPLGPNASRLSSAAAVAAADAFPPEPCRVPALE